MHHRQTLVGNPNPQIKNTLRSVLGLITVIILKRLREYSKQQIYSMLGQRWKRGDKISDDGV